MVNTLVSLNSPVVNTPGCLNYSVMNMLGSHNSPVVNTQGSLDSPGGEYTGESIKNMNISSNIRKNSNSFLGVYNGTRRSCLIKKGVSTPLVENTPGSPLQT